MEIVLKFRKYAKLSRIEELDSLLKSQFRDIIESTQTIWVIPPPKNIREQSDICGGKALHNVPMGLTIGSKPEKCKAVCNHNVPGRNGECVHSYVLFCPIRDRGQK